jgi:hypothetical protein
MLVIGRVLSLGFTLRGGCQGGLRSINFLKKKIRIFSKKNVGRVAFRYLETKKNIHSNN